MSRNWVGRPTVQYYGRGSTAFKIKGESIRGRGHYERKRSGVDGIRVDGTQGGCAVVLEVGRSTAKTARDTVL